MDTTQLIRRAEKGLAGRDAEYGWPISDGALEAGAHSLLALVVEQQRTNGHLAGIANSLDRIAAAIEQTQAAPEPEPKRRLWLPGRRTA